MTDITKEQAGRHLGKAVTYADQYDSNLLVAVERIHNRVGYGIDESALPFIGYDTWNAYEVSFLLENGFPVSCVAKISYPCDSHSIVESKSIKLYLNSFNMTKFPGTKDGAVKAVEKIIASDLTNLLGATVSVAMHFESRDVALWNKYEHDPFLELEDVITAEDIEFTHFNEDPEILQLETNPEYSGALRVHSNLLRSNCRITNQPDWGDVYIHIEGMQIPTAESLTQYIVSMRKESHFHEEICECIYKRLWDKFQPEKLMVTCIYTRRGGIDICPARASHSELLSNSLKDVHAHVAKTLRQ